MLAGRGRDRNLIGWRDSDLPAPLSPAVIKQVTTHQASYSAGSLRYLLTRRLHCRAAPTIEETKNVTSLFKKTTTTTSCSIFSDMLTERRSIEVSKTGGLAGQDGSCGRVAEPGLSSGWRVGPGVARWEDRAARACDVNEALLTKRRIVLPTSFRRSAARHSLICRHSTTYDHKRLVASNTSWWPPIRVSH